MKTIRLSLRCLVLTFFWLSTPIFAGSVPLDAFQLIPQPQEITALPGSGLDTNQLVGLQLVSGAQRVVMGPLLSHLSLSDQTGPGTLCLEKKQVTALKTHPEGYLMTIAQGAVKITAATQAGLFYGCQSLHQLLEDGRDMRMPIPACDILDYPALAYRAIHIDVKHHLDTMKYYYDCIDRLAAYKINAVIFEFEDKLRYRRRPLIGAPQAISIEEMAALTRYAQQRHIEISPLVQGLGHASFILKHEDYVPLREDPKSNWTFCPKDEGTYEVLFDMYLDAMEATPDSRYLHIGGDEIRKIGICDRCRDTAQAEGVLGLNLYWLNRVCDFIVAHGRTPIFWDDMPLNHAGLWKNVRAYTYTEEDDGSTARIWAKGQPMLDDLVQRFPRKCIYNRWTYNLARNPGNIKALNWYRENNIEVMIATAAQNVSPLMPLEDRVDIIRSFTSLAAELGIDRMLCTAWDDSSPHMETYWRGFAAAGEYSWNPTARDLDTFEAAWFHRGLSPQCNDPRYLRLYADISDTIDFWCHALYQSGDRRKNGVLMDLPKLKEPGAWSRTHKQTLTAAKDQLVLYKRIDTLVTELLAKAVRNHYHLQILKVNNDHQVSCAKLLLGLAELDQATDSTSRKKAALRLRMQMKAFSGPWEQLKATYAKTRFIAYPDSYIKDRYFHLASRTEDLDWLLEPEQALYPKIERLLDQIEED